jgi:hypothetical protein
MSTADSSKVLFELQHTDVQTKASMNNNTTFHNQDGTQKTLSCRELQPAPAPATQLYQRHLPAALLGPGSIVLAAVARHSLVLLLSYCGGGLCILGTPWCLLTWAMLRYKKQN